MEDPELQPNRRNLMNFFRVHAQETPGVLDDHIQTRVLVDRVADFATMWKRTYSEKLPETVLDEVRAVCKVELMEKESADTG